MTKKLFIIVSLLFSLLFISTVSFANNMNSNPANVIRNTAAGAIQGTRNGIQNAAGAISNMTNNMGGNNAGTNAGGNNAGNNAGNTMNSNPNATRSTTGTNGRVTTNYQTARTATDIDNTRKTSNAITWVTLGIAAVVITAIVWYFASTSARRD